MLIGALCSSNLLIHAFLLASGDHNVYNDNVVVSPEPHQLGRDFLQVELKVLQFLNENPDPLLIIVVLMETECQANLYKLVTALLPFQWLFRYI